LKLILSRRTYGQETGEDIREGFEPSNDTAVADPKNVEDGRFQIGEDGEDSKGSEESMHWKQASEPAVLLKPKYGLEGEAFENVWGGTSSDPPPENP
jgi:hypothetical protein